MAPEKSQTNKMKICMLSAFYAPMTAGSEVFTKEISERLVADGHEVHVVTGAWSRLKNEETMEGVHVHRIPSVLLSNITLPSLLPGMFFTGLHVCKNCDVIHAHLAFPPGFIGAKIKKLTGKPLVTTVQGGDMGIYPQSGLGRFFALIKPCIRFAMKSSDTVTSISNFLSRKAKDLGAVDTVLVRNGTDTEKFNPSLSSTELRKNTILKAKLYLRSLGLSQKTA
jgi:glycosyltransferase involved in cell wall biosynthesis